MFLLEKAIVEAGKRKISNEELGLTKITQNGVVFETGRPVVFPFMRNEVSSPYFGATFQQDMEPAGRFMIFDEHPDDSPMEEPSGRVKWTKGVQDFRSPLVIWFNTRNTSEVIYDENSWKARLSRLFKGKKKALSRKLREAGYDGIVTVTSGKYATTKEIVALI